MAGVAPTGDQRAHAASEIAILARWYVAYCTEQIESPDPMTDERRGRLMALLDGWVAILRHQERVQARCSDRERTEGTEEES